jgi:AraC-like DNA-binding protein
VFTGILSYCAPAVGRTMISFTSTSPGCSLGALSHRGADLHAVSAVCHHDRSDHEACPLGGKEAAPVTMATLFWTSLIAFITLFFVDVVEFVFGLRFVQSIAQSLAIHLVRTYTDPNAKGRDQRGGLPAFKLRRVIELLEAHLDQEFSLDRLAREIGLSEFHFCRLFKKTTGFTPSRYFIRLRMEKARRLLRETTKNVIEVGLDVGYSSPSHFAQIFKREVGIAPSAYRGQV